MALFDDINKANAELERLRKQYEDLSGKEAPLFDVKNIDEANKAILSMKESIRQVQKEIDKLEGGFVGIQQEIKGILDELTKAKNPTQSITKEFGIQERITRKLKDDQLGISKLSMSELKTLKSKQASSQEQVKLETQRLADHVKINLSNKEEVATRIEQLRKGTDKQKQMAEILSMSLDEENVQKRLSDEIDKRIKKEENMQKAMGITGGLLKGVKGTLDAMGFGGLASVLNLDDAQKAMEDTAEELGINDEKAADFGDKLKIATAGAAALGEGLMNALTDPSVIMVGLANQLINAFTHLDKTTGDIAKNMNMTYDEALQVTKELKSQAAESGSMFVTTEGLAESMLAVNQAMGTSVKLSKEQAAQFTEMREAAGFTNEELVGIVGLSSATGKSMKEISGEFMAQARLKAQEFDVALNEKDLLKDIQNVSAATTLSFGKNPGLIAEAVAATKALGLELGQVDAIADSLLNFEQSIANEMEAEMLLGKQLNLEKARQAALDNDLATLAEEINTQIGTSADFAEMNRIQQEAAAKAIGMNREELAQMLFTQEQLVGLSAEETAIREKQIKELEAEGLSQAEIKERLANTSVDQLKEQASLTEEINAAIDKMKEAFGAVALAFMPIVSGMATFFGFLAESPIIMGALVGVLGTLATIQAGLAIASMVTAVGKIFSSFSAIPFGLGIPAAIATVVGLGGLIGGVIASIPKGDDILSPGGSGGGYGSRMLFGPEGAIALNNKDTVIAGTNLFKGNDVVSAPAGAINMNQGNTSSEKTNQLPTQMVSFQKKQPGFSRVSLYEVQ